MLLLHSICSSLSFVYATVVAAGGVVAVAVVVVVAVAVAVVVDATVMTHDCA